EDVFTRMQCYADADPTIERAQTVVGVTSKRLASYGIALEYVVSEEGINLTGTLTIEGGSTPLKFGTKTQYPISGHNYALFGNSPQISNAVAVEVVKMYESIRYPAPSQPIASSSPIAPIRTGQVAGLGGSIV
ncbi:MAG: hypothetical protein Q7S65_04635, partial [Nanoarchaeota archaeon]|nr:hypothetical protein [Nanoarchaeota archaeon]